MYIPIIDKEKCTKCGECIDVCPADVIEDNVESAKVTHPEECLGCDSCVAVCPDDAIRVEDI